MLSAQNKEYRTRSQVSFEIATDPERLFALLTERTRYAQENGAVHYDKQKGIRCASGLVVVALNFEDANGSSSKKRHNKDRHRGRRGMSAEPMILTGANYSPFKGARKHCGEMNVKEEIRSTDIVAPFSVLYGPTSEIITGREIEGNRPMHICLHNCIRCRALFSEDMLACMFNEGALDPSEALTIRQQRDYHDDDTAPYPTFGTIDPKGRTLEAMAVFCKTVITPLAIAHADRP
jgi:hypothetical protein